MNRQYDLKMPQISAMWPIADRYQRRDREIGGRLPKGAEPPLLVAGAVPVNVRRAVYTMAQCFRREFRYDFVQYEHPEAPPDPDARAFLFLPQGEALNRGVWVPVIGGCCF